MARAVLLQIITDAQAGQANVIRNLPELLLPAVLQLPIAAIWKATLKGVLPSFSESQKRCVPISSSGTESSASLSKVFSSSCRDDRLAENADQAGGLFLPFSRLATVGASPFFMPTRAFMAPMAATAVPAFHAPGA
jgi:hypothetical protein